MSDRPYEWKKIAKMVFWKGVLISTNKPIFDLKLSTFWPI
jgi:hypothetical protein